MSSCPNKYGYADEGELARVIKLVFSEINFPSIKILCELLPFVVIQYICGIVISLSEILPMR